MNSVYRKSRKFINIVKEYPCLYDANHEGYRISALQSQVWQEVSEKFGESPDYCKKKWEELFMKYEQLYVKFACQRAGLIPKKKLKSPQNKLIKDMRYFKRYIRLHKAKMHLLQDPKYSIEERKNIMDYEHSPEQSPDIEQLRVPPPPRPPQMPQINLPTVPRICSEGSGHQPALQNFQTQHSKPAFQRPNFDPAFQRPNFDPASQRPNFDPAFKMPHPPPPQQDYRNQNFPAVNNPRNFLPPSQPWNFHQPVFETQRPLPAFYTPSNLPPCQPNFPSRSAAYSTSPGSQYSNANRTSTKKELPNERFKNLITIGTSQNDPKLSHEKEVDMFFSGLSQQITKSGMCHEKFKDIQSIIMDIVAAKLPEYNQ